MSITTLSELRTRADSALLEGRQAEALHLYTVLLELAPLEMDVRLRVADALLSCGEVQRAAVVYTALARHAAHAGHPLRALIALKVLTTLEPLLGSLLTGLAELYAVGSPRLGRGVRISLGDRERRLPEGFVLPPRPPLDVLAAEAEKLGADLQRAGHVYPDRVPPIPLFSELPPDAFARVLGALKLRRTRPGEVVIQQGQPGQSFFVIARGDVAVDAERDDGTRQRLATLHEGAIFGEMALVSAAPRSATVTAMGDADLLEFDRDALAAASSEVATVAAALDKFTRERLLSNLLATAPLFSPLGREERVGLVRRFSAHDLAAGVTIVQEGAPGQGLYLLLAGEVRVQKGDAGAAVELATLRPGDVFGELSLIDDAPASASVVATRQSTVLFLPKETFGKLVDAFPAIGEYIRDLGEERRMDTRLLLDRHLDDETEDDAAILI